MGKRALGIDDTRENRVSKRAALLLEKASETAELGNRQRRFQQPRDRRDVSLEHIDAGSRKESGELFAVFFDGFQ